MRDAADILQKVEPHRVFAGLLKGEDGNPSSSRFEEVYSVYCMLKEKLNVSEEGELLLVAGYDPEEHHFLAIRRTGSGYQEDPVTFLELIQKNLRLCFPDSGSMMLPDWLLAELMIYSAYQEHIYEGELQYFEPLFLMARAMFFNGGGIDPISLEKFARVSLSEDVKHLNPEKLEEYFHRNESISFAEFSRGVISIQEMNRFCPGYHVNLSRISRKRREIQRLQPSASADFCAKKKTELVLEWPRGTDGLPVIYLEDKEGKYLYKPSMWRELPEMRVRLLRVPEGKTDIVTSYLIFFLEYPIRYERLLREQQLGNILSYLNAKKSA